MNTKHTPQILLCALLLTVGLACTLTAPPAALVEVQNSSTPGAAHVLAATPTPAQNLLSRGAAPTQTALPSATITPQGLRCQVNTEALNVRACAGLTCAPVAWLYAGDTATILPTPHPSEWLPIEGGWIYAKFCEAKP